MIDWIFKPLLKHPKKSLLLFYMLALPLMYGNQLLEKNYLMRYWVQDYDPLLVKLDVFTRHFGNDEAIVLSVETKEGVLKKENALKIYKLTQNLNNLKNIDKVISLFNFQFMDFNNSKDSSAKVSTYLSADELTKGLIDQKEMFRRQDLATKDKLAGNLLISKDGKTALIYAVLIPTQVLAGEIIRSVDYKSVNEKVQSLVEKLEENSNFKIGLSGNGHIQYEFLRMSEADVAKVMPLVMFFIIGLLFFIFRTFISIVISLTIIWFTVSLTFSYGGIIGVQLESIVSAVPLILITICMADSIHLLHYYYLGLKKFSDKDQAIMYSLKKNFLTTFLTSFTTGVGFISLCSSDLVPIQNLGLLSAIGTILAWPVSLIVFTLFIKIFSKKAGKTSSLEDKFLSLVNIERFVAWISRAKLKILWTSLIAITLFLFVGSKNEVNTTPIEWFKDSHPVKIATRKILDQVKAAPGPEIIAHSGADRNIIKPEFLKKVNKYVELIMKNPRIKNVINPALTIKELNQLDHNNDKAFFKIPDSETEILRLFFNFRDKLGSNLKVNDRVTQDFEALRLSILWDIPGTKLGAETVKWLYAKAKEVDLDIDITGKSAFFLEMNQYVVSTFFKSMGLALLFIGLILIVLFRSVKLGVLAIIPNLLPISFALFFMQIIGVHIDIGTALVCSVCLGIAVDDTIHFMVHFINYKKQGHNSQTALTKTISTTGKALVFTTLVLVVGFFMFVTGDFVPNLNFGLVCSVSLFMALVADLVFLPALLLSFTRD
jgi:predicted RND superfamily exporter protein